jgi:hypothetical protein
MSALPSAPNSLSINQIAQEFGGDTPHAISEYYAGGSIVPAGTQGEGGGIPSSGSAISIGDFFGSRQRVTINLTISSNTQSYQISQQRGGTYEAGFTDIVLTNNAQVGSTAVGTAGIYTGTAPNYASGDTIKIINAGHIRGRGGNGGAGMANNGTGVAAGQIAGDAIETTFPLTVVNNSGARILGGGGGGGGGARGSTVQPGQPGNPPSQGGGKSQQVTPGQPSNPPATQFFGGGGGGGGAGNQVGSGGGGGSGQGQAGQAGGADSGGAGGDSTGQTNPNGGAGGAVGAAGGQGTGSGDGAGGAAGHAIESNGNQITLQNAGQTAGATS